MRNLLFLGLLVPLAGCNPDDAFCDRYVECREKDEDLDDDAAAVCKEELRVQRDTLGVAKNPKCKVMQDASDAWHACMAAISDCDDFSAELSQPDTCKSERKDLDDARDEGQIRCFALPFPTPEGQQ